jgi:hypothetical protein
MSPDAELELPEHHLTYTRYTAIPSLAILPKRSQRRSELHASSFVRNFRSVHPKRT